MGANCDLGYQICDEPPFNQFHGQISYNVIYETLADDNVYSVADGIIIEAQNDPNINTNLGRYIKIDHLAGMFSGFVVFFFFGESSIKLSNFRHCDRRKY